MAKRALIITAATIGSGVFALPYVIAQAGWVLAILYYAVLGTMVVVAHTAYLKTLAAEGEKERLLGLARKHFGPVGFWFGFLAIVLGLLLSFVIFLILGTRFLMLLAPALPYGLALGIFWLALAILTLVGNRRAAALETISVLCVAAIILFVFVSSSPTAAFANIPAVNWANGFLPFGVILFTLAGWTGVEPFYESGRTKTRWQGLALGTGIAILLYWLFTAGILGSAPHITTDTISGLAAWPLWKRDLLAAFGLFAILTVAMPISHELRNALEKDLHWPKIFSGVTILLLPLLAVLIGFTNFLAVVGLAGGVFLSAQYLLLVAVSRRALTLKPAHAFLLDLVAFVFLAATVYEIVKFVIQ